MASVRKRARQQVNLTYGPQDAQLRDLLTQAGQDYHQNVNFEKGSGAGIRATTRAQIKPVRKYYGEASSAQKGIQGQVDQKLSGLSSIADDIKASSATEAAGFLNRLNESRAGTLSELRSRISDSRVGEKYAIQNALQTYHSDLAKVNRQKADLARQKGNALGVAMQNIQAADAKAAMDAAKFALDVRKFRFQKHKFNVQQSKGNKSKLSKDASGILALSVLGSKGIQRTARPYKGVSQSNVPKLTGAQQGSILTQIETAHTVITNLARKGIKSSQVKAGLLQGALKHGKKTYKVPKIKGAGHIPAHTILNAAYDIYVYGSLSRPNRSALRGVNLPARWRRPVHPSAGSRLVSGVTRAGF